MEQKVHKDKTGLYVTKGRRKFRPTATTSAVKGDGVWLWRGAANDVSIRKQEWDQKNSQYILHYDEKWTTTDTPPQIRERLKDGQVNVVLGTDTRPTAVVGHDGFNHGNFRRTPTMGAYGYTNQTKSEGFNVLIVSQLMLTWDDWDELTAKIAEARTLVEIGPIATKLEDEVKAHEDLQDYLRGKGLVSDEETAIDVHHHEGLHDRESG